MELSVKRDSERDGYEEKKEERTGVEGRKRLCLLKEEDVW